MFNYDEPFVAGDSPRPHETQEDPDEAERALPAEWWIDPNDGPGWAGVQGRVKRVSRRQDGPWTQRYDLSHARCDPAHCLAPGLFRSLKRGERKKAKLDVIYEYGRGRRVEFSGPEPLGADDLRILQGLIAMAGPRGRTLPAEPTTETGRALRQALKIKWDAVKDTAIMVETTYEALAREIGFAKGGKQYKDIQRCIERMWKVSIIAEAGGKRRGFRLLSEYASNAETGRLVFALNPMIAQAVAGHGRYICIQMSEARQIRGEAARLIHSRLCAWINPGRTGTVSTAALYTYLWPGPTANVATMRKRRQRTRQALTQLAALGWSVVETAPDKFRITRAATTR